MLLLTRMELGFKNVRLCFSTYHRTKYLEWYVTSVCNFRQMNEVGLRVNVYYVWSMMRHPDSFCRRLWRALRAKLWGDTHDTKCCPYKATRSITIHSFHLLSLLNSSHHSNLSIICSYKIDTYFWIFPLWHDYLQSTLHGHAVSLSHSSQNTWQPTGESNCVPTGKYLVATDRSGVSPVTLVCIFPYQL